MYRRFGEDLPARRSGRLRAAGDVNQNISWAPRAPVREVVVDLLDDRPAAPGSDPADRDRSGGRLRRLPVRQRTVLVLRFYDDATDEDIAAALGCRRGTVRSLASRGFAALRGDPTLGYDSAEGDAR